MSDNVHILDIPTRLKVPPERIWKAAEENTEGGVVVIGWDGDGEFYFASSIADGGEVLWLLKLAEKKLLEVELS